MAFGKMSVKIPSIETLSTSLTYVALTGALLTPLLTTKPALPPAVEAHAAAAPVAERPVVASPAVAHVEDAAPAAQQQAANAKPAVATAALPEAKELAALPPSRLIAEARARLKSIRAKEARNFPVDDKPVDTKPDDKPLETAHAADVEPVAAQDKPVVADVKIAAVKAKDAKHAEKEPKPAEKPEAAQTPTLPADGKAMPPAPDTWSDADVTSALKECLRLLAPVAAEVEVNTAMRKGECGTPAPILLKSVGNNPKLTFQPAVEINCPMAVALGEWATDTLQPAARDAFGSDVKSIVGASGYSCRNRYGLANERLSEHALANAIDIAGFALANGRTVRVTTAWGDTERDRVAAAKTAAKTEDGPKIASKEDPKAASKSDTIKSDTIKGDKKTTPAALKGDEARKAGKAKADDIPISPAKVVSVDGSATTEGRFLRRLHKGACETFGTVLGPEANEAHRDHFHFDLKARKRRAVCH